MIQRIHKHENQLGSQEGLRKSAQPLALTIALSTYGHHRLHNEITDILRTENYGVAA